MIFLCRTICLIALIATAAPSTAVAYDILPTFKFQGKVGLDESTRHLINGLPKEVVDQVVAGAKEVMPLLDKSVLIYLNKIHEVANSTIENAACVLSGAASEAISAGIRDAIGRSEKDYIGGLLDFRDAQKNAFHQSTTPDVYRIAYAKILVRAYFDGCVLKQVGAAMAEIKRVTDDARMRWSVWDRVSDAQCVNADACYRLLRADTAKMIEAAEPRDLKNANASQRFASIPIPEPVSLGWSWSPGSRETAMFELLAIGDTIRFSEWLRDWVSNSFADEATGLVEKAEANIVLANAAVPSPQANTLAGSALADQITVQSYLQKARDVSKTTRERVDSVSARFQNVTSQVSVIAQAVTANTERLRKENEEKTRAAEQDQREQRQRDKIEKH